MPARAVIDQLPAEVRGWLERELLDRNFAGYLELTEALNARLQEVGLEVRVSKSSVHRFGQEFETKVDALKRTTAMAQTIARDLGDDEGAMNDAVIRLVQDRMFATVLDEQLTPKSLNSLAHAAADLARASVMQKKHMAAVRTAAERAANEVAATARKAGLSDDTVEDIKRRILGIADAA